MKKTRYARLGISEQFEKYFNQIRRINLPLIIFIISIIVIQPYKLKAQITFASGNILNPYGLSDIGSQSAPGCADMDGDGDLDLLAGEADGTFNYYENTGSIYAPDFNSPVTNPFGLSDVGSNSDPYFSDLDADGDYDIIAGESTGNFYYFQNDGTATSPVFTLQINPFGLTDIGSESAPAFADIDNDGDFDLLVGEVSGNIIYFQNSGTASSPVFSAFITNPFGLADQGTNADISYYDFDDDGDLDILTGIGSGSFIYNRNDGTASSPVFGGLVKSNPFDLKSLTANNAVACADLNGDGLIDILSGVTNGNFYYNENRGTNTVTSYAPFELNPFGISPQFEFSSERSLSTFADLDTDGDYDILIGRSSGGGTWKFVYEENMGTIYEPEYFTPAFDPFNLSDDGISNAPAFGDLDSDGDLDLICGQSSGNFYYWQNSGTPTEPFFNAPVTNPFGLTNGGGYAAPTFIDINNDGDLDLMVGNTTGNFRYFENIGNATSPSFASMVINPFGLTVVESGRQFFLDFTDLDQDGDFDIITSPENFEEIKYYQNIGSADVPLFDIPLVDPFGFDIPYHSITLSMVDMDNDGDDDFIGAEETDDFVYVENISPCAILTYFADADGDGFGDPENAITTCGIPPGYVFDDSDCDDNNNTINPFAIESCNSLDDNCDGNIDEEIIDATISPDDSISICKGTSTILTALTGVGYSYQWYRNGTALAGAVASTVSINKAGSYYVVITVPGGCSDSSSTLIVTQIALPTANISTPDGLDLCFDLSLKLKATSKPGYSWQWYKDGSIIDGETNSIYYASVEANYKCRITNASGCSKFTPEVAVFSSCREELNPSLIPDIAIYPNPASDHCYVELNMPDHYTGLAEIMLMNIQGEILQTNLCAVSNGNLSNRISLNSIPAGLYLLKININGLEYKKEIAVVK